MAAKQLSGKATEGFQALSPEEHARKKGMWAGALTRITGDYPGLERTPEGETRLTGLTLAHCPALFKCADELIVNATDHERECRANPPSKRVTSISVTLDEAMGWVTVENDGPGIPVVVHEEMTAATGRPVYIPELVYAIMLAGTNMDKAADNIKGGTNGVGGKLPAIHSSEAVAETVDAERGLLYIQIYRDQMREVSPPSVFKLKRTAPKGPDGGDG
jgi:DNA topoisomerase-2